MNSKYNDLKTRLGEISDLTSVGSLLAWDESTMMPPGGAQNRAEQRATVGRIAHERFTSDEIGQLLDDLAPFEESMPFESDEASLIRVVRRDYEKARRVPAELQAEMTRAGSLAYAAWVEARRASAFDRFLPYLERNVELTHQYVACFEPAGDAYDVLLDDYERGMKTEEVKSVFDGLKHGLAPLVNRVNERADAVVDDCLLGHFPRDGQRQITLTILEQFGFSSDSWRLDPTEHPFATSFGTQDIRITNRYHDDHISPALFGTMHEWGHGLYEHQVSPSLERTPLRRGASMALHESQSRMWENLVGRSRPFWQFFFPRLRDAFPAQFTNIDSEAFYRAVNKLQPSLIRVEADEATYNMHIILRFELEQEILAGQLALSDLPEAWNARMREYLGVTVPDDAHGVLQDVHWALGSMGYFPTYSLGNVVAVQIWERALTAMPDLPEQFARGEFTALRVWLRDNLHCHGRKFTPRETLERVAGGQLDPEPYLRYLSEKVDELYGVV